eukprot:evm.model.scf_2025.4 EVM.evm.TU.scf_2025.4   scf_2025:25705-27676(-)
MAESERTPVRVGVLALQGSFREHIALLRGMAGVQALEVRTNKQLESCCALIIPGGESTTMALLAERWGMMDCLREFARAGRPIWGTCAGLIFLADRALGQKQGGQPLLGGLDVLVHRNFFGAQINSFEMMMPPPECLQQYGRDPFRAVFIRAPAILEYGEGVEVLSEYQLTPSEAESAGRSSVVVAVKQGSLLATAFHPELTGDSRWYVTGLGSSILMLTRRWYS